MNILSIISNNLCIIIVGGNIYVPKYFYFVNLPFFIFVFGVVDILCIWYELSPYLTMTLYGHLYIINNVDGFSYNAVDINISDY